MIYRILAPQVIRVWDEETQTLHTIYGRLRGGFVAGIGNFPLAFPKIRNPRTRFYFTEKGWREVGRFIVARARRDGHKVRVYRRKNPLPSQIVYKDVLQVAILPRKDVPRKGRK